MRRDVTAALRLTLQGHLTLRKSRLESFCVLVVGFLLSRTVNLSHLACMFPTQAAIASNYRRLQRFFAQVIDCLHCETIADRSRLHDWHIRPHRHYGLHQFLLITEGKAVATSDSSRHVLPAP